MNPPASGCGGCRHPAATLGPRSFTVPNRANVAGNRGLGGLDGTWKSTTSVLSMAPSTSTPPASTIIKSMNACKGSQALSSPLEKVGHVIRCISNSWTSVRDAPRRQICCTARSSQMKETTFQLRPPSASSSLMRTESSQDHRPSGADFRPGLHELVRQSFAGEVCCCSDGYVRVKAPSRPKPSYGDHAMVPSRPTCPCGMSLIPISPAMERATLPCRISTSPSSLS